jgi:hypothetical protein
MMPRHEFPLESTRFEAVQLLYRVIGGEVETTTVNIIHAQVEVKWRFAAVGKLQSQ